MLTRPAFFEIDRKTNAPQPEQGSLVPSSAKNCLSRHLNALPAEAIMEAINSLYLKDLEQIKRLDFEVTLRQRGQPRKPEDVPPQEILFAKKQIASNQWKKLKLELLRVVDLLEEGELKRRIILSVHLLLRNYDPNNEVTPSAASTITEDETRLSFSSESSNNSESESKTIQSSNKNNSIFPLFRPAFVQQSGSQEETKHQKPTASTPPAQTSFTEQLYQLTKQLKDHMDKVDKKHGKTIALTTIFSYLKNRRTALQNKVPESTPDEQKRILSLILTVAAIHRNSFWDSLFQKQITDSTIIANQYLTDNNIEKPNITNQEQLDSTVNELCKTGNVSLLQNFLNNSSSYDDNYNFPLYP